MQLGVTLIATDLKKLEGYAQEKRLSLSSAARLLMIERLKQLEEE